ncbi:carboxypeptidase-like regulatory domain-containing protein [Stackebrandtia albiflava]|uniref:carboxypeptidase-like regulatory domain-containing protein n=1 Tax=Stackebrandtia albiflava TaxID=406432 RepID=UPI001315A2F7|nr:carboxypeptidase-like regulatory domain-containing protein [Stackebrandtia albiflava]
MSRRIVSTAVVLLLAAVAGCGSGEPAGRTDPDAPVDDSSAVSPVAPEGTGTVTVTVVDAAGEPVAGAMVVPEVVESSRPGFAFSEEGRFTDAAGVYTLAAVPPGEYTVSVVVDGEVVAGPEDVTVTADATEALALTASG